MNYTIFVTSTSLNLCFVYIFDPCGFFLFSQFSYTFKEIFKNISKFLHNIYYSMFLDMGQVNYIFTKYFELMDFKNV